MPARAGLGVYYGIREYLNTPDVLRKVQLSAGIAGKRYVVQGFGNVGYWAAKYISENGGLITGVIEYNGAVFNPDGLDVERLNEYKAKHGTLMGFAGAIRESTDTTAALEVECDVLVPAAAEKVIHKDNAARIKAKIIAEGANGPTTPFAETILEGRGTIVIPDLLLNAGGVTVSYFEWLKNLSHVRFGRLTKKWEESGKLSILNAIHEKVPIAEDAWQKIIQGPEEVRAAALPRCARHASCPCLLAVNAQRDIVFSGLEDTMVAACRQTIKTAHGKNVNYRMAAYINALNKISQCYTDAGITI